MIRKGRLILCVAVLYLLQSTVVHRFSYGGLRPDLLYLAAVFLAWEADAKRALTWAFALGILRDLGSTGRLGGSALLLVPATALLLAVRDRLVRESVLQEAVLTFAYVLACGLVGAAAVAAFTPATFSAAARDALGQAVFTAALSPLFFVACNQLGLIKRPAAAGFDV